MKKQPKNLSHLGRHLLLARTRCSRTQKELAEACGLAQSDISKIEAGERWPTPPQLACFARELGVSLQWFLTGRNQPGFTLGDLAIELRHLGITDLFVLGAGIPGAFRPQEQIVAAAVAGDLPDPRIVEALPAVLAWNRWNADLLTAFGRASDPRAPGRLAWLADIALTIHRGQNFPGGLVDPLPLSKLVRRTKPCSRADDLGRPANSDDDLPPVSRRWNIRYDAPLDRFCDRAVHLLALRTSEGALAND